MQVVAASSGHNLLALCLLASVVTQDAGCLLPQVSATPEQSSTTATDSTTAAIMPSSDVQVSAQPSAAGTSVPPQTSAGIAGSSSVSSAAASGVPQAGSSTAGAAAGSGAPVTTTKTPDNSSVDWPLMGYDPGSTYFNKAETMLSKDTAARLEVLWTADLGGNVTGGAVQVGDKIYASGPGAVFAFDANSGTLLWKSSAASSSTPGYADGTVFLHSTSGNVMAFDAADGKMKWSISADASGTDGSSSAIVVGGTVLVGGSNGGAELSGGRYRGFMAALDAATGAKKWTTFTVPSSAIGASFWSSAAVSQEDGLVFGGTGNNYGSPATDTSDSIIAFALNTGEIKWKFQARMGDTFPGDSSAPDSDFGNNPVLYEALIGGTMTKMVADGTKYGNVVALKRLTGEMVWRRDLCAMGAADGNSGLFTNFSYSSKKIVAACNQGGPATLYALDAATGNILWMRALQGNVWGRMAHANGVGVVGTGEKVEIFDEDTGAVIKSFPSKGGTVASTISISRGRIAFGEGFSWSTGNSQGSTLTVLGLK